MKNEITYQHFGKDALLVSWKDIINKEVHDQVLTFNTYLLEKYHDEIVETIQTYQSIAVFLKEHISVSDFITKLKKIELTSIPVRTKKKYLVTIPVCYDVEFGLDLKELSELHGLSIDDTIGLHSQSVYEVFFIGFLPGFPYLGGLNPLIHTPRKKTPRQFIEKGSVGIAGGQTGVYTIDSPGGWNVIGKTPLDFFDATKNPPSLLTPGDHVRFVSISKEEFFTIEALLKKGTYKIGKEVYND